MREPASEQGAPYPGTSQGTSSGRAAMAQYDPETLIILRAAVDEARQLAGSHQAEQSQAARGEAAGPMQAAVRGLWQAA
jgi:hypothetical protein